MQQGTPHAWNRVGGSHSRRLPSGPACVVFGGTQKMLWIVLAILLLMWARGRTTSYTLSGLIRNLAGHRVGGGIQQPLAEPMSVGE